MPGTGAQEGQHHERCCTISMEQSGQWTRVDWAWPPTPRSISWGPRRTTKSFFLPCLPEGLWESQSPQLVCPRMFSVHTRPGQSPALHRLWILVPKSLKWGVGPGDSRILLTTAFCNWVPLPFWAGPTPSWTEGPSEAGSPGVSTLWPGPSQGHSTSAPL